MGESAYRLRKELGYELVESKLFKLMQGIKPGSVKRHRADEDDPGRVNEDGSLVLRRWE